MPKTAQKAKAPSPPPGAGKEQDRCPDGTWMPSSGDCVDRRAGEEEAGEGGGAAVFDDAKNPDYVSAHKEWISGLSGDESLILRAWAGAAWKAIIKRQTTGELVPGGFVDENRMRDFESALGRAPMLRTQIWRGMNMSESELAALKSSKGFTMMSHTSWSTSRLVAKWFSKNGKEGKIAVMLRVESGAGVLLGSLNSAGERESLVHPGTRYEVVSLEQGRSGVTVTLKETAVGSAGWRPGDRAAAHGTHEPATPARFASGRRPDPLPEWAEDALARIVADLKKLTRANAMESLGIAGADEVKASAMVSVRASVADIMAASDLAGRKEVLERVRAIIGAEDAKLPLGMSPEDHEALGTVPQVPFGEAVQDILRRAPELAGTATRVAKAYAEGPSFALARSCDISVTRNVQRIVGEYIEGGQGHPGVSEIMAQSDGFTRAYAETVLRTNSATAATNGRFAQMRDPDVRAVVPAFRYSATRDSDVRRGRSEDHGENHLAADGLVAAADDPIWQKCAPPNGYNCRCSLVMVTTSQLRREGLIDASGTVVRKVPAGFGSFRRNPNFARTQPPGAY